MPYTDWTIHFLTQPKLPLQSVTVPYKKFKTEFQNYVDNLSEADLASSNIKTVLSEKADELGNSLSTAKMKLSCEVENVEVHNAGGRNCK